MKFLAFTDLHEDKEALQGVIKRAQQDDIEFVICAGDISTFGRGLKSVLKQLDKLEKPVYVIPGNHEEGMNLDDVFSSFKNCKNIHQQAIEIGNYVLLAYGGGGFAQTDAEFRKIARGWYGKYNGKKTILLTHGPPFQTKLDDLDGKGRHVGSIDYRKFIERIKPKLAISGHLHETVGAADKVGTTKLINPGWDGMVIELK